MYSTSSCGLRIALFAEINSPTRSAAAAHCIRCCLYCSYVARHRNGNQSTTYVLFTDQGNVCCLYHYICCLDGSNPVPLSRSFQVRNVIAMAKPHFHAVRLFILIIGIHRRVNLRKNVLYFPSAAVSGLRVRRSARLRALLLRSCHPLLPLLLLRRRVP